MLRLPLFAGVLMVWLAVEVLIAQVPRPQLPPRDTAAALDLELTTGL